MHLSVSINMTLIAQLGIIWCAYQVLTRILLKGLVISLKVRDAAEEVTAREELERLQEYLANEKRLSHAWQEQLRKLHDQMPKAEKVLLGTISVAQPTVQCPLHEREAARNLVRVHMVAHATQIGGQRK